jgi:peptidoglycan-associated lipoprotein
MKRTQIALVLLAAAFLIASAGCKKKQPVAPPPPPPAPTAVAAPAAKAATVNSFTAEPSTIVRGDTSTLRWSVSDATSVTIDNGIGTVPASGSRSVSPTDNATYRMTATGAGGDAVAAVTVYVTNPPPPPPPPAAPKASLEQRLGEVQDILFDYDKSEVREDARAVLQRNADVLKAILSDFPSAVVTIEGNCDERGSAEYNLGLGDRRATAAKEFLTQVGLPADRLKTISYGKEKPVCSDSNESCWQKNRHDHFAGAQ